MAVSYDEFVGSDVNLESIIPKSYWNYVTGSSKYTASVMEETWIENLNLNLKQLYPRHGSFVGQFGNFGKNKAVICVGAGPSFNKNKKFLKEVYDFNIKLPLNKQPFIIIASNHQYRPLLEMGILPHFVLLMDGGSHIYDQLTKKMPPLGKNTVLISTLLADNKMLNKWRKQGKGITFFLPEGEVYRDIFVKSSKDNPEPMTIGKGGNVINSGFLIALNQLGAREYIVLGNDLSFPLSTDVDNRRNTFYADGDYSTNHHDEASDEFKWMGFEMEKSSVIPGQSLVNFSPMMTSKQLFMYKLWAEMHIGLWAKTQKPFHFFNCSEGGICGVIAKSHHKKDMEDRDNWVLMDDLYPKRWHTRTFMEAVTAYLETRAKCQTTMGMHIGAVHAVN